jgi:hypothetical protein
MPQKRRSSVWLPFAPTSHVMPAVRSGPESLRQRMKSGANVAIALPPDFKLPLDDATRIWRTG